MKMRKFWPRQGRVPCAPSIRQWSWYQHFSPNCDHHFWKETKVNFLSKMWIGRNSPTRENQASNDVTPIYSRILFPISLISTWRDCSMKILLVIRISPPYQNRKVCVISFKFTRMCDRLDDITNSGCNCNYLTSIHSRPHYTKLNEII